MGTPTLNDLLPASAKDLEKISTVKRYEQQSQNRFKVWTDSSWGFKPKLD